MIIYNHSAGRLSKWARDRRPQARRDDAYVDGRTLHPTRGWRSRSPKSTHADVLAQQMRHDLALWFNVFIRPHMVQA